MPTDVDDVAIDATKPTEEPGSPRLRLLAYRVTGSSRQRLLDALDCEIVESDPVDLIVISTRMPLGQVSGALAGFRRLRTVPVVAIVHAGGEDLAAELLRAGAAGLVAEGNEAAVAAFVEGGGLDVSLVETYEQRLGRTRPSDLGLPGRDPVTGLPTVKEFETALTEVAQTGDVPRVGFLRVLHYEDAARRLSNEAVFLLRRRLSAQFREIGRLYHAELFSCSPTEFAFVASGLSSGDAREMGQLLVSAAEAFAPSGGRSLSLALGHAGPEVTTEIAAVRELAQRALELASSGADSIVLSADDLSRTLAATTELEVLLRLVDTVERDRPGATGVGYRAGSIAARIAQHLGFEGLERSQVRLAAHLHEIGKISLPPAVLAPPEDLTPEDLSEYRRYPELGAGYLRTSAGREVAAAVRHHQERWDGAGFPDGLAAEDIPVAARMVAVAVALAAAGYGGEDAAVSREAFDALSSESDQRFDPTVVAAAHAIFGPERHRSGDS